MDRQPINVHDLRLKSLHVWDRQWFLLTCGDFAAGDFNTMTVAWGSFGTMWHKPFAQIVVRPVRHTFTFLERYPDFTLSAFPKQHKKALGILGTKSGRDGDKISETGLTPAASRVVASPCFAEAELVVECRKIYWDDLEPSRFIVPAIEGEYPEKDYHRIYFGEIVAVDGTPSWSA